MSELGQNVVVVPQTGLDRTCPASDPVHGTVHPVNQRENLCCFGCALSDPFRHFRTQCALRDKCVCCIQIAPLHMVVELDSRIPDECGRFDQNPSQNNADQVLTVCPCS